MAFEENSVSSLAMKTKTEAACEELKVMYAEFQAAHTELFARLQQHQTASHEYEAQKSTIVHLNSQLEHQNNTTAAAQQQHATTM